MRAQFSLKRESNNTLFYAEWINDSGIFHFHSQVELYFVNEGKMEVFIGNQRKILSAGEMSVALSYNPHGYNTPVSSASGALIIPTYLCGDFLKATKEKCAASPFITNKEAVKKIKEQIRELFRSDINDIEKKGRIYVILGIIMDNLILEDMSEPLDAELASRLLFWLNENFKGEVNLAAAAAHLGYSQSYLSRYFKARFGIPFNKYLNLLRLKNAVALMHESGSNVTVCALESGFSSMRTFYRVFSEEFGCSPKEYIKGVCVTD